MRGDLLALVRQSAEHHLENAHVAAGLASRLRESNELAGLIREHAVDAGRARFARIVERAVARGELAVSPTRPNAT